MELTPEMAAHFAGGHIEVQNLEGPPYYYRCEIGTATVEGTGEDATFKATLTRLAMGNPPNSHVYEASLRAYSVSDIGKGRLLLESLIDREAVALYPPNVSNLDTSRAEEPDLG